MRSPLVWSLLLAVALAGCLQQSGGGDDAETGAWTHTSEYGVDIYDVTLHERITPGSAKTWAFEVRNGAPADNPVEYEAACGGPFVVTLFGIEGDELQPKEPGAQCAASRTEVLDAGDTLPFSWTWDGRIWVNGEATTPLEGVYTIRVQFNGLHAGEHAMQNVQGETTVFVDGR